MAQTFSVQIPTSPHIKCLIRHEFGDPIPINNQSLIGVFMIGVLQKENFNTRQPDGKADTRFLYFTEKVTCVAPISLLKDMGWNLKRDHIIQFNRFFEEYFDRELYIHVKRNTLTDTRYAGYKQAIESFAARYFIEVEQHITYEALKKKEYRYRMKVEDVQEKSFATLSSPQKQTALFQ